MSDREDNDSDAPEEFTADQGIQLDEEIRKIQRENKARVIRQEKERRRKWAQNITPRPSKAGKISQDVSGTDTEPQRESNTAAGFLPDNIVQMLAAREKRVFSSDANEEKDEIKKPTTSRKRKSKKLGLEPLILSELGPPQCVHSALDFLKERKLSIRRSSSVLNNPNQALRLLSSSGVIRRK